MDSAQHMCRPSWENFDNRLVAPTSCIANIPLDWEQVYRIYIYDIIKEDQNI